MSTNSALARSEAIHVLQKPRLIDCFQYLLERHLDYLVLIARNCQWPHLAVVLRYVSQDSLLVGG